MIQVGAMLVSSTPSDIGSRKGRKDTSRSSKGSNPSLADMNGGYHPFYQLNPNWHKTRDHHPGAAGAGGHHGGVHPLTEKHLKRHTQLMEQQNQGRGEHHPYVPPDPRHIRSKSKDSSKKEEQGKSGFWNKGKQRSKSENRDKNDKNDKMLRAEQYLQYQKAVDKKDRKKERSTDKHTATKNQPDSPEIPEKITKHDKKQKSGNDSKDKDSSLSSLKFWKNKRRSVAELPQSSKDSKNEASKKKRHSIAEYPVSKAASAAVVTQNPVQNPPQVAQIDVVVAPEPMEMIVIPPGAIEVLPSEPETYDQFPLIVDTDTSKDKENLSKRSLSRRSKSADSFRMKSTDSGFHSSRSKSPELLKPKPFERQQSVEKPIKKVQSSDSIRSKASLLSTEKPMKKVKSSESIRSKSSAIRNNNSVNSMAESAQICNSLMELCVSSTPASPVPMGVVTSTPTSPVPMDRNNNGQSGRGRVIEGRQSPGSAVSSPQRKVGSTSRPSSEQRNHQPPPPPPQRTHSAQQQHRYPEQQASAEIPRRRSEQQHHQSSRSRSAGAGGGTIVHRQRSFKSGSNKKSDSRYPASTSATKANTAPGTPSDLLKSARRLDYREFATDLANDDAVDGLVGSTGKMLAKATRAIQEHVKDVTEKSKHHKQHHHQQAPMKEYNHNPVIPNYHHNNNHHHQHHDQPVPYIVDKTLGITYMKGKLLGKGGFAKCYELIDVKTNKTYAGKIISKNRISKPHQREKIAREIELHRQLRHKNVVLFHSYFEDDDNVYIILENCSRKSLVHVLKSRKTLTEPEVRFYLRHLVEGCKYIHRERIIHRDLKLGNMLLNGDMHVKIADFGLATRVEYEGEKKMTVCGTPNYIAPEVLQKKGHSYEADIWAIGCVMYAMLVGRPPFETSTLKETYMRITANKYFIPPHISKSGRHLIQKLLHPEPLSRPTLDKILADDFFTAGYLPKSLPTSACDSPPKFPSASSSSSSSQRPKSYAAPVSPSDAMSKITSSLAQLKGSKKSASQIITRSGSKEDNLAPPTPIIHLPADGESNSALNNALSSCGGSRDNMLTPGNNSNGQQQQQQQFGSSDALQQQQQQQQPMQKVQHIPSSASVILPTSYSAPALQQQQQQQQMQQQQHYQRHHQKEPLHEVDMNPRVATTTTSMAAVPVASASVTSLASRPMSPVAMSGGSSNVAHQTAQSYTRQTSADVKALPCNSAIRLYQMLSSVLDQLPPDSKPSPVQDPKTLWVTKWVDYSNKYGFGFQLSDKSCGVLFNDTTRMLLASDGRTVQYNDLSNRVYTFSTDKVPSEYHKKSTLLLYFAQYMDEHLIHGGDMLQRAGGEHHKTPAITPTGIFMKKWFRTSKAIVMYLNNGTLQVNFFEDHTKVILSPEGQDYLVTYINSQRQAVSYRMLQFRHFGCHGDIQQRLSYSRRMLESIINIEGEAV